MPEAVIVAAARSPIGRANKGHLVDVRPDDLAAYVVSADANQARLALGQLVDRTSGGSR